MWNWTNVSLNAGNFRIPCTMRILRLDTVVFVICAFVSVFKCIFSFSDLSSKDSNNIDAMDHNSLNSTERNKTEKYFKQIYPNAGKGIIKLQT